MKDKKTSTKKTREDEMWKEWADHMTGHKTSKRLKKMGVGLHFGMFEIK